MIRDELLQITQEKLAEMDTAAVYEAVLTLASQHIEKQTHVSGTRKVYYMSAEFLIGKLLSNNLMNLGIYDEVAQTLSEFGHQISDIEDYDPEPSLGNGGLGRLAACFLDSIATLGINGEGLGLNYHFGLFRQVFENHLQVETKDEWLNKKSWLRKTDTVYPVVLGDVEVTSRMYEIDIVGYTGKKTSLRLFDLDSLDESLVTEGIDFDQKKLNKNLTLFLYPDDSTQQGLRLRFAQQYFMVQSGLQYILDTHKDHIKDLDKHVAIQINDTHPSMVIILLINYLQEQGISFEKALRMTTNICAYTNHTILAEALETWPLEYFAAMDLKMLQTVRKLDTLIKTVSSNDKVQIIDRDKKVHMAALAIHFSHSTNGVAALHTEILTRSELKEFYRLYPGRFNNKTNGITFRRWLLFSNPQLSQELESLIGNSFKADANELEHLLEYTNNQEVQNRLLEIKANNKQKLAKYLKRKQNITINTDSIFDIQIKRLHEYKRQQMNMLYIIDLMSRIRKGYRPSRPITFFFGSKAAPAYIIAKDIIHALLTLSDIIRKDELLSQHIQLVFVENYNVSAAEQLIPAADVSEQISLASKEASGTGNMKFMLNGALTLGTLDGANVEIAQLVGDENIYIFGKHSNDIIEHYEKRDYVSKEYYESDPVIKNAVDYLISEEMLSVGSEEHLIRLFKELVGKDWFMTLIDLKEYIACKDRMFADYEDRQEWARKMIINIAHAGFFSSDRTIEQYNKEIWRASV